MQTFIDFLKSRNHTKVRTYPGKGYDVIGMYKDREFTYQLNKITTPLMMIETERKGRPSGIEVCEAVYWVTYDDHAWYIINTDELHHKLMFRNNKWVTGDGVRYIVILTTEFITWCKVWNIN
jgi:hypothetical protein